MNMFRALIELDSLYEATEATGRWKFIGKVEYFDRLNCCKEYLDIKDPIYVNGISRAQALSNAKFVIRQKYELPANTVITLLNYSIEKEYIKVASKYCPDCLAELNDGQECPRCNPNFGLGDTYDGEELD